MGISEVIYLILISTAIVFIPLRLWTHRKNKREIEEFQASLNEDLGELRKIIQSRVVDKGKGQVSHIESIPENVRELFSLFDDVRSMQGVYNRPESVRFRSAYEMLTIQYTIQSQWKIDQLRNLEDLLSIVVSEQRALRRRQEAIWERMNQLERIVTETTTIYGGPSGIDMRLHMGQS